MKLTREQVVMTALRLLNEVGVDGLTTRRVAEALGVQQPALYWHFKNKRALLDAMVEAMASASDIPRPADPAQWRVWLVEEAIAFRKALLAYRDGARIHVGTRPDTSHYAAQEEELRLLQAAGFQPADALRLRISISFYTVGWALEEQAAEEAQRGRGEQTPPPDPAAFPLLAQAASVLRQENSDRDFEIGLNALIDGFERKRSD